MILEIDVDLAGIECLDPRQDQIIVQPLHFVHPRVRERSPHAGGPLVLRFHAAYFFFAGFLPAMVCSIGRHAQRGVDPRSPSRSASAGLPKAKTVNADRTTGADFLLITQRHESA